MDNKSVSIILGLLVIVTLFLLVITSRQLGQSQESLSVIQDTLEKTKTQQKEIETRLQDVITTNNHLDNSLRISTTALEKMKGRADVVEKKPSLVENMINNSFDEFEKGMKCATSSGCVSY